MAKKKIAIFASGSGSNALKIMTYFEQHDTIEVALVVTNKVDAGVLAIAKSFSVPNYIIKRTDFYENGKDILNVLSKKKIDFIVLAGFLWLVPEYLVNTFKRRIINIHPALLPKYGGKGMYGHHVHEAVKAANESLSGMTIHYVNAHYDEGDIIFQATCPLVPEDSALDIAQKVLALEHAHFAKVIDGEMKRYFSIS